MTTLVVIVYIGLGENDENGRLIGTKGRRRDGAGSKNVLS